MDPQIEELKKGIHEGMKQTDAFLQILDITERCCQDEAIRNIIMRYDELETRLVALEELIEINHSRLSGIQGDNFKQTQIMDRLLNDNQGMLDEIEQRLVQVEKSRMNLDEQDDIEFIPEDDSKSASSASTQILMWKHPDTL